MHARTLKLLFLQGCVPWYFTASTTRVSRPQTSPLCFTPAGNWFDLHVRCVWGGGPSQAASLYAIMAHNDKRCLHAAVARRRPNQRAKCARMCGRRNALVTCAVPSQCPVYTQQLQLSPTRITTCPHRRHWPAVVSAWSRRHGRVAHSTPWLQPPTRAHRRRVGCHAQWIVRLASSHRHHAHGAKRKGSPIGGGCRDRIR